MNINEFTLSNVDQYKDFKDFQTHEDMTQEEFNEGLENGMIQNITLGTYNGATNEFYKREITDAHIVNAIEVEVQESEFKYMFEEIKNHQELVEDFVLFYSLVVIKDDIYILDF